MTSTAKVTGVVVILALLLDCSSGDSSNNGGRSGGAGQSGQESMLNLIRRNNDLTRETYGLYCERCPCGFLQAISPEAEECIAAAYDAAPLARDVFLVVFGCQIRNAESETSCLQAARDCGAAEECVVRRMESNEDCGADISLSPQDEELMLQQVEQEFIARGCHGW